MWNLRGRQPEVYVAASSAGQSASHWSKEVPGTPQGKRFTEVILQVLASSHNSTEDSGPE